MIDFKYHSTFGYLKCNNTNLFTYKAVESHSVSMSSGSYL